MSGERFFDLMLDGIALGKDLTAVLAIGLTCDDRKLVLDFQVGSSENCEVCDDLLYRFVRRGFKPVERLYCVLDGSGALCFHIIRMRCSRGVSYTRKRK